MAFKQLTEISFIADSVEGLKKLPSKRSPEDIYTINHHKECESQKIDRKFIPANLINYTEIADKESIKNKWLYINNLTNNLCERVTVKDIKNYTNAIESNSLEEALQK